LGLLDIFKRGKTKRYAVFLTARGKKYKLGIFEARSYEDLADKIMELLDQQPELSAQYPRIHVTDLATGESINIKNPFATESEEEQRRSSEGSTIDPKAISKIISDALTLQGEIYKAILTGITAGLGNTIGETVSALANEVLKLKAGINPQAKPEPQFSLKDAIAFVGSLRWLIENRDKVSEAIKFGIQTMQSKPIETEGAEEK